jgi:hypothetical protein
MNLNHLKDKDLLTQMMRLIQSERDLLVSVLHHLREIERRRLFADLGYSSLFDYAVGELKYSEGQAGRRIAAMRLLKDLPADAAARIETKITTGELSLSNVQQASSFFRDQSLAEPRRIINAEDKLQVLELLENKSVRAGQKELLRLSPEFAMPKEKERVITDTATEVRFTMSDALKIKLESVRALLGLKGANMSYAALFDAMSDLSLAALEAKKFGKKRAQSLQTDLPKEKALPSTQAVNNSAAAEAPTAPSNGASNNTRYIPQSIKHFVWQRDRGVCTNCGTRRHLNYDHVRPLALGGGTTPDNLRLLCFQCNQRAGMRTFGVDKMRAGVGGRRFGC